MKKVLALVLSVVLAFGMTLTSFAANTLVLATDADGDPIKLGESGGYDPEGSITGDLDDLEIIVANGDDTEIWLPLSNTVFEGIVKESHLSKDKIKVKKSVSKGSAVIDDVDFDSKTIDKVSQAYVVITFVDQLVSTSSVDFNFTVYLTGGATNKNNTSVEIAGTLKNVTEEVDEDDDYVYSGDGAIIKALDYIKKIEVDLGNGVSITTKMFDGRKYYGVATIEATAEDDAVLTKYPEIDAIYTIKQVGLNGSGNIVTIDVDDKYFVYNADGEPIGTTADALPFSSKYYLSTKKIDFETDDVDEDDLDDDEDDVEEPDNDNDNPDTGVNGLVNVAVVAGVVALAAAGAVAFKK